MTANPPDSAPQDAVDLTAKAVLQERIETLVSEIEQVQADWAKDAAQVTALRTALEDIGNGPSLWGYEHSATARAALSAVPDTTTTSGESDG